MMVLLPLLSSSHSRCCSSWSALTVLFCMALENETLKTTVKSLSSTQLITLSRVIKLKLFSLLPTRGSGFGGNIVRYVRIYVAIASPRSALIHVEGKELHDRAQLTGSGKAQCLCINDLILLVEIICHKAFVFCDSLCLYFSVKWMGHAPAMLCVLHRANIIGLPWCNHTKVAGT